MERYIKILEMALEAVFANRFRSFLTALGIIFGVSAVIAMLAIGNGARQEILEQIKLVGVNNIIITPILLSESFEEAEAEGKTLQQEYSPGLHLNDAHAIDELLPYVQNICPEVIYETYLVKDGTRKKSNIHGITSAFFSVFNTELSAGRFFSPQHEERGSAVCLIGPEIKNKFFPQENPIGKYIKAGDIWLRVIGILKGLQIDNEQYADLGISEQNNLLYVPLKTLLLRYNDRSVVSQKNLLSGSSGVFRFGNSSVSFFSSDSKEASNQNQLDKIVVQLEDSRQLESATQLISRLLKRRHQGVEDFKIQVPELLLKQEQKTKEIFNIVLGAIAGISLLVGGIGIMNIMLASVIERIREIGVRRASGATQKDIILQFLSEAMLISLSGGIIGVALGVFLAKAITSFTEIQTIISGWSILISFGVAAAVGMAFGYLPARKAAEQDPVESLRHD